MKLLYVVHQYFPECYSGTEQYCLATSREARRRGDDVAVLSLVPDFSCDQPPLHCYDAPYDGFPVLRLRQWGPLQPNDLLRDYEGPLVAARFRAVLREWQPDVVHFFHLRNLGSDLLAAARDAGCRTVVHLMDFWYLCPQFTLLRRDGELCQGPPDGGLGCVPCMAPGLQAQIPADALGASRLFAAGLARSLPGGGPAARFAALIRRHRVQFARLARADAVIAPSRFLADMFVRNGFPQNRIRVVPYGLEPGRVVARPATRPRQPLRLGFAGVLSPWKAPHLAVDAVRQIEAPVALTVYGRTAEPMFQSYIDAMLARSAGDPRITFPGPFDPGRLGEVLADLDLLIVPSTWYENTPFVILEAFAAGLPVVASDLGGMTELIEDGVNGYSFERGNAAALAALIGRCAGDPQQVANLAPSPPPSIAANYDRFLEVYQEST